MGKDIVIRTMHCCGTLCTYIYSVDEWGHWKQIDVQRNRKDWLRWERELNEKNAKKIEWKAWHNDVIKSLKELIAEGFITEEQAKKAYEEWLLDNPNPDPEEEAYDVTEEFARRPIRIKLPERAERE